MPEPTFAEAISACQTVDEVWHCWIGWPRPSEALAVNVARSATVWDVGLVQSLVIGKAEAAAISNPTWPAWGDVLIGEHFARALVEKGRIESVDLGRICATLCTLVSSGRMPQDSGGYQILLGTLDGRSRSLTERLRSAILVLSEDPNMSPEVFEHLFTVAARGKAFGRHGVSRLLRSKYMSDAHWVRVLQTSWDPVELESVLSYITLDRLPEPVKEYLLRELRPENEYRVNCPLVTALFQDPNIRRDPVLATRIAHVAPASVTAWAAWGAEPEVWSTLPDVAREEIWKTAALAEGMDAQDRDMLLDDLSRLEPERVKTLRTPPPTPVRRRGR